MDSPLDFSRNETIRNTAYPGTAVAFDSRSEKSKLSHFPEDLGVKVLLYSSVRFSTGELTFRYASRTRGCNLDWQY
jgi:hypothetical protein